MADVLPKFKMYLFISIITMIFNIIISFFRPNFSFGYLAVGAGTAFLPFASLLNLIDFNIDGTVLLFIAIITTLMSTIQAFILAMIILSVVSNLIWSPNV